jgi:hypothetical protein
MLFLGLFQNFLFMQWLVKRASIAGSFTINLAESTCFSIQLTAKSKIGQNIFLKLVLSNHAFTNRQNFFYLCPCLGFFAKFFALHLAIIRSLPHQNFSLKCLIWGIITHAHCQKYRWLLQKC